MPVCEGPPHGTCPHECDSPDVQFGKGDLFLCTNCRDIRFPDHPGSSASTEPPVTRAKSQNGMLHTGELTVVLPEIDSTKYETSTSRHCTVTCKHDRKERKEMLRCCTCMVWYHLDCLCISKAEAKGFWTCLECRLLPKKVLAMYNTLQTITDTVVQLQTNMSTIMNTNTELEKRITEKDNKCSELINTVSDLRTTNAKLITELAQARWTQFRMNDSTTEPKTVLVGSSVIRDIDEKKLSNTKVVCCPGALITTLNANTNSLPSDGNYDKAILVGGGNDCSNNRNTADILDQYQKLVISAKNKAKRVVVVSICPRGDKETQQRIDIVNAGLQGLCADMDCTYKDSTEFLKLNDGSINEGYYMDDLVHLTYKGQNKLAQMMDLKPQNTQVSYNVISYARKNAARNGETPANQAQMKHRKLRQTITPISTPHSYNPQNSWHGVSYPQQGKYGDTESDLHLGSRRNIQRDMGRDERRSDARTHRADANISGPHEPCTNCGEQNHNVKRCRFSYQLDCRLCGQYGHKAKHHDQYESY